MSLTCSLLHVKLNNTSPGVALIDGALIVPDVVVLPQLLMQLPSGESTSCENVQPELVEKSMYETCVCCAPPVAVNVSVCEPEAAAERM